MMNGLMEQHDCDGRCCRSPVEPRVLFFISSFSNAIISWADFNSIITNWSCSSNNTQFVQFTTISSCLYCISSPADLSASLTVAAILGQISQLWGIRNHSPQAN
jgi:hypothetical protein